MNSKIINLWTIIGNHIHNLYQPSTLIYVLGTFSISVTNLTHSLNHLATALILLILALYSAFNTFLNFLKVKNDSKALDKVNNDVTNMSHKLSKVESILETVTQTLALTSTRNRGING